MTLMQQEANSGTFIPGEARPEGDVAVIEHAETAKPETDADDIKVRARAQGWRPIDEFNGDPDKWRSAEEFVAKGENELPVLRENLRRMTSKLTELETARERDTADWQDRLRRIEGTNNIALRRQRDDLEARYAHAIREAANTGDMDRFDKLEVGRVQALQQFDSQVQQVVAPPAQQNGKPALPPHVATELETWHKQNPWFEADPELNAVAQAHHMRLNRDKPGMSLRENLAEVTKYVSSRYADKFGSSGSSQPAAVEGGGSRMSASAPRGKSASDLPADARRVAEAQIKQGLFKDLNDYAKEYWSQ